MYQWFLTLTDLEIAGTLESAALKQGVKRTLRRTPRGCRTLRAELSLHQGAYVDRYGDHGAWPQLGTIIDWAYFHHMWRELIDKEEGDQAAVAQAVQALAPGRSLLTLNEIRAMSGFRQVD